MHPTTRCIPEFRIVELELHCVVNKRQNKKARHPFECRACVQRRLPLHLPKFKGSPAGAAFQPTNFMRCFSCN